MRDSLLNMYYAWFVGGWRNENVPHALKHPAVHCLTMRTTYLLHYLVNGNKLQRRTKQGCSFA